MSKLETRRASRRLAHEKIRQVLLGIFLDLLDDSDLVILSLRVYIRAPIMFKAIHLRTYSSGCCILFGPLGILHNSL